MNADTHVHGYCDPRFAPLRDAFAENFAEGLEIGASLALTHCDETVVDLWAGHRDRQRTLPWEENTICSLFSATKIMLAIAMLTQVDRGQVDLDAPVARYWPEFAEGGKERVTVRDVLGHCGGVPGLDPQAPWEVVKDWDALVARIAREPHWFGGRRQVCYHPGTYGYILAEIIRRVDGRRPRQYCAEEVSSKCGADIVLGITNDADYARLAARQFPEFTHRPEIDAVALRTQASFAPPPDRRSELSLEGPSGHGFSNGRGLARLCAIAANGGALDGVRILSPELVAEIGKENSAGICPFFGPIRWGLGFALPNERLGGPSEAAFWWGGMGGSRGLCEPVRRVSFGYVPNNLRVPEPGETSDAREQRLTAALADVLQKL